LKVKNQGKWKSIFKLYIIIIKENHIHHKKFPIAKSPKIFFHTIAHEKFPKYISCFSKSVNVQNHSNAKSISNCVLLIYLKSNTFQKNIFPTCSWDGKRWSNLGKLRDFHTLKMILKILSTIKFTIYKNKKIPWISMVKTESL
jgi:hypothetical protein